MSAHIGVTGLAVMGANLARNLARNGFTVALHNRSVEKTDALLEKHGQDGDFVRTETLQELVDSLEKPRRVLIMVKAGKPVDSVIEQLEPLLEAGRHHHRRRQLPLRGHPPPRSRARQEGPALRRHRRLRRRGRRPQRPVDHARRLQGVLRRPRPAAGKDRRARRRQALLRLDRHRRRRPLRQDGPQRHRIRRHAGHRRSLRPAALRRRHRTGRAGQDLRRVEQGRPRLLPDRNLRRGPRPRGRQDRQAVRRRRRGRRRPEGHRPLDGHLRARAGLPDVGHRRVRLRPRAVLPGGAAQAGPGTAGRRRKPPSRSPKASSRTSARRCTPPSWSPTRRGWTC